MPAVPKTPAIFVVSACRIREGEGHPHFFTCGWFPTFEDAEAAVLNKSVAVFEYDQYNVAVIERIEVGFSRCIHEERWYQRDDGTGVVQRSEKPTTLQMVVGFAF